MFGGGTTNPYDEVVIKTTDENLTSENWELILNLCDKVQDEGQEGAHSVIASVLKRLAHRNPNVQLYALSLAEALSKNCTIELHREIASRAFTQGLEKLITDRTTHEKVRRRALGLIAMWTSEFENDSTLGIMGDCFANLQSKNYKFETPQEPPPPTVDDEIRRKEEEELQRVLEMSMQDKGGRDVWSGYTATQSNGAGGSGSSASLSRNATASASTSAYNATSSQSTSSSQPAYTQPKYQAGYAPVRTPSPENSPTLHSATPASTGTGSGPASNSLSAMSSQGNIVTRVRALHTFEPTEPGELAFDKGDVIKVVDRGYKDWWRGQLKGRTGIFPVNYVEAMPEPTSAELAKESEQEAAVFAQAVNVEKLLNMLRSLDPAKDNLADNEEIQELYRSSMALRPKIVKLIDKYSQKRADLVSMNETFVRARTIFDRMMEESLARHTGVYDQPTFRGPYPRPDSRGTRQDYGPQPYGGGWGGTPAGYEQQQAPGYGFPAPAPAGPGPVGYEQQGAYPAGGPAPGPQYAQQQPQQQQPHPVVQQQQQGPGGYRQSVYVGQPQQPYGSQGPTPYPAVQPQAQTPAPAQAQVQAQPQPHVQPQQQQQQQQQPQPQPHVQPQQSQPQPQAQPQAHPQAQAAQQASSAPPSGPPYVYDPTTTYADPNVQAWAQYYAHGGKELAGAVYFISIPGLTDGGSPAESGPIADGSASGQQDGQLGGHAQQAQTQGLGPAQEQPAVDTNQGPASPTATLRADSMDSLPYPGTSQTSQPPLQRTPSELLGYAGSPAPASQLPQQLPYPGDHQQQLHPQQQQQPAPGPTTPSVVASSTPSWVLPKMGSPPRSPVVSHNVPASVSLHDPGPVGPPQGAAGNQSWNSAQLSGQFAGMSVGGAGGEGAQSPPAAQHPHAQYGGYQGVGAPA